MISTAPVEDAAVEAAPSGSARPRFDLRRMDVRRSALLAAALVIGLPGLITLSRFLGTIALSLVLGH